VFAILLDVAVRQSTHRLKSLRHLIGSTSCRAFEILFEIPQGGTHIHVGAFY
jgi:hypothetical protein